MRAGPWWCSKDGGFVKKKKKTKPLLSASLLELKDDGGEPL